jgi:flagellar hook-length control protein FliK
MGDLGELVSSFRSQTKSVDTSQQMFELVDTVGGSFEDQLSAAKNSKENPQQEKVSSKEKKEPTESPEETAVAEEPTVEAEPKIKAQLELTEVLGESAVLEEETTELNPELLTQETDESTVGIEGEETVETLGESEEGLELAQSEQLSEAETDESEIQENIAAAATIISDEEKSSKITKSSDGKPLQAKASVELKTEVSSKGEELIAADEAKLEPEQKLANAQEQKIELADVKPVQEEVNIDPKSLRQTAVNEADLEISHDIIPENELTEENEFKHITIKAEEGERVEKDLKQLQAESQIQAPNPQNITSKLLEGLKATNAKMAQDLEVMRLPQQQSVQQTTAVQLDKAVPFKAISNSEPSQNTDRTQTTRLTHLKDKIVEQVKLRLQVNATEKGGEVSIRLKPQFLGNMKVTLSVEETVAKAVFLVENQSVKEMLQRNVADLSKALEEQGIEVDSIDIESIENPENQNQNSSSFASAEDQKAAREWIASFYNYDGAIGVVENDSSSSDQPLIDEEGSDQVLNIIA